MKKIIFALLLCTAVLVAQAGHPQNAFKPDQIKWGPPPPFVNPGAKFAVLEGDPGASSGDFTIRIVMPSGYKIAPLLHNPYVEFVVEILETEKGEFLGGAQALLYPSEYPEPGGLGLIEAPCCVRIRSGRRV